MKSNGLRLLIIACAVTALAATRAGTSLHRYEQFEPEWESLSPHQLGERELVYEHWSAGTQGSRILNVIVSEEKTICRETSRVDPSLQVSVLFDPGTARPVAFTEGGECLTEPLMREYHDLVDGARCRSLEDRWVFIDGYAWPSEGSTETSLKELSNDRIDTVRKHLKNSAFPSKIADTTAHGSSRTAAPSGMDSPLPGVTLRLSKSAFLEGSPRGVTFRQFTGRAVREEQLANLRDFAANHRDRLMSGQEDLCSFRGPIETVKFRAHGGEILDLPTDCAVKSAPIVNAVGAWAQDLSDNGCDVSNTDPLSSYLDDSS